MKAVSLTHVFFPYQPASKIVFEIDSHCLPGNKREKVSSRPALFTCVCALERASSAQWWYCSRSTKKITACPSKVHQKMVLQAWPDDENKEQEVQFLAAANLFRISGSRDSVNSAKTTTRL